MRRWGPLALLNPTSENPDVGHPVSCLSSSPKVRHPDDLLSHPLIPISVILTTNGRKDLTGDLYLRFFLPSVVRMTRKRGSDGGNYRQNDA